MTPLGVHAADGLKLGFVHQRMILGKIAIGQRPPQRPEKSDRPANIEYRPPAKFAHDQHDNRRCDRGAEPAGAMRYALHEASFGPRIPKLHGARGAGKRAGFADAEHKPDSDEGRGAESGGGRCRHDRPKTDHAGKHAAGTEPVAQPAAGDLKQRVGPGEGAEDDAHRHLVEAELFADLRRCGRNIDAVEVGDEIHHADQQKHIPSALARARGCRIGHQFHSPVAIAHCKARESRVAGCLVIKIPARERVDADGLRSRAL